MVKPLYPLSDISPEKRKKQKEAEKAKQEARKAYIVSLCKNPFYACMFFMIVGLLLDIVPILALTDVKIGKQDAKNVHSSRITLNQFYFQILKEITLKKWIYSQKLLT